MNFGSCLIENSEVITEKPPNLLQGSVRRFFEVGESVTEEVYFLASKRADILADKNALVPILARSGCALKPTTKNSIGMLQRQIPSLVETRS